MLKAQRLMRIGERISSIILMSYNREPNWQKLKPEIDWDEQENKLADKLDKYINQNKQTVMNQSVVKSQKFVRDWNGPSGTIYYFDLVLENGEVGQVGVKDMQSPKIAVGATIHYTSEERTGPTGRKSTNFKLQNPNPFNGGGTGIVQSAYTPRKESPEVQNSISRSVALNNAVLFCKETKGSKPSDVLETAEIFLAWLKEEEVKVSSPINTKLDEAADDEMPF
jgi:hypothetical protein